MTRIPNWNVLCVQCERPESDVFVSCRGKGTKNVIVLCLKQTQSDVASRVLLCLHLLFGERSHGADVVDRNINMLSVNTNGYFYHIFSVMPKK